MIKRLPNIYCLIASLMFPCALWGQGDLPTGKIEVVKDFEVRLAETQKFRIVPQPIGIDSNSRHYEYKLQAQSPSVEYTAPDLKPLALQTEKRPTAYPFFAKAGYGSPNALVAQVSYDQVDQEDFQWGFDLRHLSANNKEIPLQQFSNTGGRINGAYALNDHVWLKGHVDGKLESIYFYGADPIPDNKESLKRRYTRYDVLVSLGKEYAPETSLRYEAFLQFMNDKDDLGSKERGLKVGGALSTRYANDRFPIGVELLADLSTLTHTSTHEVNNLQVTPYAGFEWGDLSARVGTSILLSNIDNEFLPQITLTYPIRHSSLTLLAGWTGQVHKNNFHFLSTYNPYISTRLDSLTNEVSRKIYAGFKGGTGHTRFELTAFFTRLNGYALFLQDEEEEEQFLPVYDNGSFVGIEGSVQFELLSHVFLRAQVYQRFFSLDHEAKPWHRPSFGLHGRLSYSGGGDRFHVAFIFNGENGLPYRTVGGTETTLDALIDLGLQGDYYFTEKFGVFGELNNLLGNNRERWVNYPRYGFNVRAGILCRLQ